MAMWLLAIETSLCVLVGLAFWYSVLGRDPRWLYLLLSLYNFLLAGSLAATLAVISCLSHLRLQSHLDYLPQFTLIAGTTIVGGFGLLAYGARRRNGLLRAGSWPRIRLLVAWLGIGAVLALTVLVLDAKVRTFAAFTRVTAQSSYVELIGPMPAEADNARTIYEQAFAQMADIITAYDRERRQKHLPATRATAPQAPADPEHEWVQTSDLLDTEHGGHRENIELLLRLDPAIVLLRQAAARPKCRFHEMSSPLSFSDGITIPHAGNFRLAASLFRSHAAEMARQGRPDAALDDVLAMRRLANHVDQTLPCLMSGLLRIGIDSMACEALVDVLPYAEIEPALPTGCLPDPTTMSASLSRHMQAEEYLMLEHYVAFGIGSRRAGPSRSLMPAYGGLLYRLPWLGHDIPAIRTAMAGERDHLHDRQPGNSWQYTNGRFSDGSLFLQTLMPSLERVRDVNWRLIANIRQAEIALALTRYRLKNGAYPDSLEALTPQWLPAIPADPFDGRPMRYRLDGRDAIIYSIDDNGKDDGGQVSSIGWRRGADVGYRLRDGVRVK